MIISHSSFIPIPLGTRSMLSLEEKGKKEREKIIINKINYLKIHKSHTYLVIEKKKHESGSHCLLSYVFLLTFMLFEILDVSLVLVVVFSFFREEFVIKYDQA